MLVVDDDRLVRWSLHAHLEHAGYVVRDVADTRQACAELDRGVDLVLLGSAVEDGRGLELLGETRRREPDVPVVVLTESPNVAMAVEAMRLGAFHCIPKSLEMRDLLVVVSEALAARDATRLSAAEHGADALSELVGESAAAVQLRELLRRVARSPASTVLLTGESGTGKDLAARCIHRLSVRAEEPFVHLMCTALPSDLIESELFGHERGAFTDAVARKQGLLESADRGTAFLDEVGDLDLRVQAKLLRFLESRTFRRVGGMTDRVADVRVVAATNVDLDQAVVAGRFRQDLYYRLAVLTVELPPLRARLEDVPILVEHFLRRFRARLGTRARSVSDESLRRFASHGWPGNVRELENLLLRAAIVGDREVLDVSDFPRLAGTRGAAGSFALPPGGVALDALEQSLLRQALERTGGNRTRAARLLGITRNQIRYRIEKFGLADDEVNEAR